MAIKAPPGRGPLGALAGVPGLWAALVRAGLAALAQTVGVVLLSAGLASAVARAAGLTEASAIVTSNAPSIVDGTTTG